MIDIASRIRVHRSKNSSSILSLAIVLASSFTVSSIALADFVARQVIYREPVTAGYVMTHEHPTAGMAFGGNYAFAGSTSNYQNGIPVWSYETCSGCFANACDHAEAKGILIGSQLGGDMGDHGSHRGPFPDSFSHLRYSTEWVKDAAQPGSPYNDTRMKIMVAYAVESEAMCEFLYSYNVGNGGAGGNGYACSNGDSRASLLRQIDSIKAWASVNSSWMAIAYSHEDARTIVNQGKLAVLIGVEADYAFGAENKTFDPIARLEEYHSRGVRTFYLAHKINSRLSGADVYYPKDTDAGKSIRAQQAIAGCFYYDDTPGLASFPLYTLNGNHHYCDNDSRCGVNHIRGSGFTNACNEDFSEISEVNINTYKNHGDRNFNGFEIYPATTGFAGNGGTRMDADGVERNNLALSADGRALVRRAMELGMIINLDHVSSDARRKIHDIATTEFGYYPVNAFHNNPNEMLVGSNDTPDPHEYDFDENERDYVRETGGIFGVRLGPLDSKGYTASGVTLNCPRTSTETAKILAKLLDEGLNLGYSLDFAAVVEGLESRTAAGCGLSLGTDYLDYDRDAHRTYGMAHIGNMERFHHELESIGLHSNYLDPLKNDGVEAFLRMWAKSEGYLVQWPPPAMP